MAVWTTSAALPLIVVGGVGGEARAERRTRLPPVLPLPLPLPLRRTLPARHSPLCARRCADSRTRAAPDPRADSVPPFPPPALPAAATRLHPPNPTGPRRPASQGPLTNRP